GLRRKKVRAIADLEEHPGSYHSERYPQPWLMADSNDQCRRQQGRWNKNENLESQCEQYARDRGNNKRRRDHHAHVAHSPNSHLLARSQKVIWYHPVI